MNEPVLSIQNLLNGLQSVMAEVYLFLPRIAAAILLMLLGWLLAKFVRMALRRLVARVNQAWKNLMTRSGYTIIENRQPPTRIISQAVYWLILLISLTLAAEILGLDIFVTGLKEILAYLPRLVAGILIMLVGFVISTFIRDLVASAADSGGISHADLLGQSTQLLVLFIAVILGIEQLGINTYFLSIVSGIFLAAILGGFALAFGLGARTHVSNVIAANQLRQIYQVGDRVRIDDIEGRVTDIFTSRVILETDNGRVDIPAKLFDEMVSEILDRKMEDET